MILVVGSTGVLGSEICHRLTKAGKPVRGLVRSTSDPDKVQYLKTLGVQTIIGDLRNPASLVEACRGVKVVISTANSVVSRQPGDSIAITDQQGHLDLVKSARSSGVKQFVFISVPRNTITCPLTIAKHMVEKELITSGMTYTVLCPGIFMETCLSPLFGFDYPNAKATIYGDGHSKNTFISLGDVAQYAVESLSNPEARNVILELGYPKQYSLLEVVRVFETNGSPPFELQFVPEAILSAQRSAATDPLQVSYATMVLNIAQGLRLDSSQARKKFYFPLTSIEEHAQRVLATLPVNVGY
jgi:NADH dehydrogenase